MGSGQGPSDGQQDVDEKEAAIRAKYKAMIEEKVAKQVEALKAKDEEKRKEREEEERIKMKKKEKAQELKDKIATELGKIKEMEELRVRKLKEEEQRKRLQAAMEKARQESNVRLQEQREKHRQDELRRQNEEARNKVQEEIAQMRKAQEDEEKRFLMDAKKMAEERRKKQSEEEERKKREMEEKRQKAVQEEMKKMLEEEERKMEEKRIEEKRKRKEEEIRVAERIQQRKREEEERQKEARKAQEEQRLRDQEELKRKLHEDKMKRFKKLEEEEERKKKEVVPERPKRRSTNNPIMSKFEEMTKMAEAEENIKKGMLKRRKKPFVLPSVKKSTNKLFKAISKEILNRSNNKLARAASREILKSLSKGSLNRSKDKLKPSRSREGLLSRPGSKGSSLCKLKSKSKGNVDQAAPRLQRTKSMTRVTFEPEKKSSKEMQNYLISQVLFDGKEDVQAKQKLDHVEEDDENGYEDVEEESPESKANAEIEFKEKMFEAYKNEMEKYLSLVCESTSDTGREKTTGKKKTARGKKAGPSKPLIKLGTVKQMFEELESPEVITERKTSITTPAGKVGKLDAAKFLEEKQQEEFEAKDRDRLKKKKKDYVPVVIDKDAFDRTMNRFEYYRQEEEDRERRRKEEMEKRRERALQERQRKEEEEERMRLEKQEQEEREMAAAAAVAKKSSKKSSNSAMLNKIGAFFTGKSEAASSGEEDGEGELDEPEVELTEEEKVAKMDMATRIKYELAKLKEQEAQQQAKIARDNKKRELMIQINRELERIHGVQAKFSSKPEETKVKSDPSSEAMESEAATVPKWVKMVMEYRERTKKEEGPNKSDLQVESREKQEEEKKASEKSEVEEDEISSKPPMNFQESVQAMLDLLEDDDSKPKKSKPSLLQMKKKSTITPLKYVGDVKSKFESLNSPTSPPSSSSSSSVQPYEINSENIKRAREHLLEKSDNETTTSKTAKSDPRGFITKKCSDIKSIFDKKEEAKQAKHELGNAKKTSIIEVQNQPSIDELLQMKKLQNKSKKWNYREKGVQELQTMLESYQTAAVVPPELAKRVQKAAEAQERCKIQKEEIQRKQHEQVQDFDQFMESVESYLEKTDCSPEETAFQNTIKGYLDLIDEGSNKKSSSVKLPKISIDIGKAKNNFEDQTIEGSFSPEPKTAPMVGKLCLKDFESKIPEEEFSAANKQEKVSRDGCQSIKDKFEKQDQLTDDRGPLKNYSKQKIIHVAGDQSVVPAKETTKREQQWKWKQKTIQELQAFIQNTPDLKKDIVKPVASNTVGVVSSDTLDELSRKSEDLAKSMAQKEKEFEALMSEIADFTTSANSGEGSHELSSAITAYLDLLDEHPSARGGKTKTDLPDISVPWKLDKIKEKMMSSKQQVKKTTASQGVIGKVKKFIPTATKEAAKDNGSNQLDHSIIQTDKLKKMFEENARLANGRTTSALNLAPKKKKVLIEPTMPESYQSEMSKWSSKITGYLRSSSQHLSSKSNRPDSSSRPNGGASTAAEDYKPVSVWQQIEDPEERKKAILAKHGFKPVDRSKQKLTSDIDDLDTIPNHILEDEILYKRYMNEQLGILDSSSDEEESEPQRRSENSTSSLLNLLGAMRKKSSSKPAQPVSSKSPPEGDNALGRRRAQSNGDLSNIPGSCQKLRRQFDQPFNNDDGGSRRRQTKTSSSADVDDIVPVNTSQRRKLLEEQLNGPKPVKREHFPGSRTGSVKKVKNALLKDKNPKTRLVQEFFASQKDKAKSKEAFSDRRSSLIEQFNGSKSTVEPTSGWNPEQSKQALLERQRSLIEQMSPNSSSVATSHSLSESEREQSRQALLQRQRALIEQINFSESLSNRCSLSQEDRALSKKALLQRQNSLLAAIEGSESSEKLSMMSDVDREESRRALLQRQNSLLAAIGGSQLSEKQSMMSDVDREESRRALLQRQNSLLAAMGGSQSSEKLSMMSDVDRAESRRTLLQRQNSLLAAMGGSQSSEKLSIMSDIDREESRRALLQRQNSLLEQMAQGTFEGSAAEKDLILSQIMGSGSVSNVKRLLESSKPDESVAEKYSERRMGSMGGGDIKRRASTLFQEDSNSGVQDIMAAELESVRNMRRQLSFEETGNGTVTPKSQMQHELEALRVARQSSLFQDSSSSREDNPPMSERERIQLELQALRECRQKTSCVSKISRGDPSRRSLTRSTSALSSFDRDRPSLDLDNETMEDLSMSNSMIKAMFESSAPKYKFGGSGSSLNDIASAAERDNKQAKKQKKAPPKNVDQRSWVMESVNKYFDVIVEEEEDDDEGCNNRSSMAAPNSDLESSEYETDYSENESVFYPDSDEERDSEVSKPVFKSTSNIRGMLSQVMNKVSSNVGASKEVLVQRIKTNLKGSQISLCD